MKHKRKEFRTSLLALLSAHIKEFPRCSPDVVFGVVDAIIEVVQQL